MQNQILCIPFLIESSFFLHYKGIFMKHTFLLFILLANCRLLNGGNGGSDQNAKSPQKTDPRVEKAVKEMNHYLSKIIYAAKTRDELDAQLKERINNDVRNPKVFPIINALMDNESNQNDKEFISSLIDAISLSQKNHIECKCKELKIT